MNDCLANRIDNRSREEWKDSRSFLEAMVYNVL